jgi:SAM-dependent methyltransferase
VGTERKKERSLLRVGGQGRAKIDLKLLSTLSQRPSLYGGRELSFWSDPYVSEHTLHAHLDPDTDAASRPPDQIEKTVQFILARATAAANRESSPGAVGTEEKGEEEKSPISILDMGCGPGLYARHFAEAGCTVTGIDLSPASIDYARAESSGLGLGITYRCDDLRVTEFGGPYDVAVMIFGEFCTFSDRERTNILKRIGRALKPGGLFILDVFTDRYVKRIRGGNDWYVSLADGFWQDDTHMVLEQTFRYPDESASVVRYTIIEESGAFRQFSVWWRHFTAAQIADAVVRAGFEIDSVYGSLWGSPLSDDGEWIGMFCRAPDRRPATTDSAATAT